MVSLQPTRISIKDRYRYTVGLLVSHCKYANNAMYLFFISVYFIDTYNEKIYAAHFTVDENVRPSTPESKMSIHLLVFALLFRAARSAEC